MHETHLIDNILGFLEKEERDSSRKIGKIYVSLSEFGGLSKEHFMEHYIDKTKGTRWEALEIEFNKVPCGPEMEITKIEFK
jgi:Zn finger protein HypA/HybF involved in hydrogenase expression